MTELEQLAKDLKKAYYAAHQRYWEKKEKEYLGNQKGKTE